jgi:hypothetical protein
VFALQSFNLMHVLLDAKSSSCQVFVDIMSLHAWPPKLKIFSMLYVVLILTLLCKS